MTIDEAMKHAVEQYEALKGENYECAKGHMQLWLWLDELKELRKRVNLEKEWKDEEFGDKEGVRWLYKKLLEAGFKYITRDNVEWGGTVIAWEEKPVQDFRNFYPKWVISGGMVMHIDPFIAQKSVFDENEVYIIEMLEKCTRVGI